ncbi:hypothetical protein HK100_009329, partial [Physocladia obscura]
MASSTVVGAQLLEHFGLSDEVYAEYIWQLVEDDGMDDGDKADIIVEFLSEAVGTETESVRTVVEGLISQLGAEKEKKREREKEKAQQEQEKAKEHAAREKAALKEKEDGQGETAKKAPLSREEKKARERLLRQYGYAVDDTEETADGETDFVHGSATATHAAPDAPAPANLNVQRVKDAERVRRAKLASEHAGE